MADVVFQEVRRQDDKEQPKIEAADFWADLRAVSPPVRYAVSFGLAALASYALWFGALAGLGVWRRGFLDLLQLGAVTGCLVLQALLGWTSKLSPLATASLFSVLWVLPISLVVLSYSTSADYLHATLAILSPIALSVLNGWFGGYFLRQSQLPSRRGG